MEPKGTLNIILPCILKTAGYKTKAIYHQKNEFVPRVSAL